MRFGLGLMVMTMNSDGSAEREVTSGAGPTWRPPLVNRPRPATSRADVLLGTARADRLSGGAGNDALSSGPRNDTLIGGSGHDRLFGGTDHDRLDGGSGPDAFDGGMGNDVLKSADRLRETVRCGPGRDTVVADRADRLIGCERVRRR